MGPAGVFWRQRGARAGVVLTGALVVFAVVGPWLGGHDPNASDFVRGVDASGLPVGPTSAHWLGTDALRRDEWARLAHGARLSLSIALASTGLACGIGGAVGVVSGMVAGGRWGWVDAVLMRAVDVLLSFPYLLLVMAVAAAVERSGPGTVLLVLGLTSWLGTARLVRAKTLVAREQGYVEAARALGQGAARVVAKHILPQVAGTLMVVASVSMASMILAESVLSYLQVGIEPPTATWGRMLYEGQRSLTLQPRLTIAPGLAILWSVLGFNLLGEALRGALDPGRPG